MQPEADGAFQRFLERISGDVLFYAIFVLIGVPLLYGLKKRLTAWYFLLAFDIVLATLTFVVLAALAHVFFRFTPELSLIVFIWLVLVVSTAARYVLTGKAEDDPAVAHAQAAAEAAETAHADVKREYFNTFTAVDRMVNGLYPRTRRGEEVLERVRLIRTIRAGGDLEAELELHVRARGGNLHFREIRFGPGPGGAHADLLGRINFKAQDLTDGQSFAIAYLPTRDEPERKSIVLAFLPAIEPTEKDARKIVVTFEWAGYWKGLLTNRFETTGYSLHGKPVGEVELVYRIQPTLGTIKLTQLTPASPFGIEPYQGDKDGLVGQCYRARQLPGEDVKLKLELVAPGR